MSLPLINPAEAKRLVEKGAIIVDIRDTDEHARERIGAARNIPLGKLSDSKVSEDHTAIIFYCKSGNRTRTNALLLSQAASIDAYILDGGIEGWKRAGLPVIRNTKQPMEIMRQVQIAAGSLVLAGAILGFAVSPVFYALSAAVGAGLMFSGISGTCAMVGVLRTMPWNRPATP